MSNNISNRARFVALVAAGIVLVTAANASAHDFGGGNSGRGGFGGGGVHYDHIIARGGRDGDRGSYDSRGGYDRNRSNSSRGGDDRSGSYNRGGKSGKSAAGNTGVYCQFCVGQRTPAPVPDPTENHKG